MTSDLDLIHVRKKMQDVAFLRDNGERNKDKSRLDFPN